MNPVERKKLNSKFIHMVADALTKGMDLKAADKYSPRQMKIRDHNIYYHVRQYTNPAFHTLYYMI